MRLLVILPLLSILIHILPITLSLPLHFDSARDFYHELAKEAIQFLFNTIQLNTKHVQILGQLIADDVFNIRKFYTKVCKSMTYSRALTLLNLVYNRKDLEMYLLGPVCLSQDIITARKTLPNMWPPRGFPLLIDRFRPDGIPTKDIKDILEQALNQSEWWQSVNWIDYVDWGALHDLRFWRMSPPKLVTSAKRQYIIRSLVQISEKPTCQDLEELLMKSMRIGYFSSDLRQSLNEEGLDADILLDKFSHLQDPWSEKVLHLLQLIYSKDFTRHLFPERLFDSELLKLASWDSPLNDDPIGLATAINDIFELFIVAMSTASTPTKSVVVERAIVSFFDNMPDWSIVRPVVLLGVIRWIDYSLILKSTPWKYADRMLENITALPVLSNILLESSKSLSVHKHHFKMKTRPLRWEFTRHAVHRLRISNPYKGLLYREWARDKINWPGMMVVHEKIKKDIIRVFVRNKDGTCDPKTDSKYREEAWDLAFSLIRFEIENDIPSSAVPSICFLRALHFHYREKFTKRGLPVLGDKFTKECMIAKGRMQQGHYLKALNSAESYCFGIHPSLPQVNDAEFLQALIRGDDPDKTKDRLANRLGDLAIK